MVLHSGEDSSRTRDSCEDDAARPHGVAVLEFPVTVGKKRSDGEQSDCLPRLMVLLSFREVRLRLSSSFSMAYLRPMWSRSFCSRKKTKQKDFQKQRRQTNGVLFAYYSFLPLVTD